MRLFIFPVYAEKKKKLRSKEMLNDAKKGKEREIKKEKWSHWGTTKFGKKDKTEKAVGKIKVKIDKKSFAINR